MSITLVHSRYCPHSVKLVTMVSMIREVSETVQLVPVDRDPRTRMFDRAFEILKQYCNVTVVPTVVYHTEGQIRMYEGESATIVIEELCSSINSSKVEEQTDSDIVTRKNKVKSRSKADTNSAADPAFQPADTVGQFPVAISKTKDVPRARSDQDTSDKLFQYDSNSLKDVRNAKSDVYEKFKQKAEIYKSPEL